MRKVIFSFVLMGSIANAKPTTLIGKKDAPLSLRQTSSKQTNVLSNKESSIFSKNLQQEINKTLPQVAGMSIPLAKENVPQDIISKYHANPFAAIKQIKLNEANMGKTKGDWIIIDSTVIIDHDTTINNNILIYNNSQLIVRNCSLVVRGIIYSFQNSLFSVDSSSLVIPQDYIYQFGMQVGMHIMDSSKIEIKHSKINSSNLPLGGGVINGGSLLFDNVLMNESFITFCTFGDKAKIHITHTDKAGEFVVLGDSSEVHISHSDTVLVWIGFPKGTSGKIYGDSLRMNNWINHFTYPDTTCDKITYSLVLDSLTGLMLATMAEDSTNVDLYNAEIRGSGHIFYIPDVDTITGLVNGSKYSDFTAPFPGRNYHLVNSSVAAWNLYFYAGTQLSIKSSIFGECLLADSAKSLFWNAVCDGAGGHIGAAGNSFLISGLTTLYTDALMEGHSVSLMLFTNFMYGHLIAKGMAATILYNTVLANPVLIYDSATVMVTGCYPPSPSHTNENIPIRGSAFMLRGPDSPFSFDGYKVEYAPTKDTTTFFPITGRITTPVDNNDICVFSTYGLNTGTYVLRLWYFFSAFGSSDSINFDNSIYLNWQNVEETSKAKDLSLSVTPNLSNKININYIIPQATEVELSLYNVSGEKVATLDKGMKNKGEYTVKLDNKKFSNGVYFCELKAGKEILPVRKIVLVK